MVSRLKVQPGPARSVQQDPTFDAFFQQHWERICETLFRLTGDWQEAEDLALETFLRLYQKPPAGEQNLVGWLYRVATNLGLNALRSRKRRQFYEFQAAQELSTELDPPEDGLNPANLLERDQGRQRVRAVLAEMKPRSALMLLLRYSDFSYAEIAAAAQVAPGSVGALLARAEKEFEKRYRQLGN
ncbi:MAG: polymerase, sigma-24 subunit, subfamily [Chloroflexi bacterium]|nr:polymerase, sigma-24 subunit, subfamily [Chloroflexota bacterium]